LAARTTAKMKSIVKPSKTAKKLTPQGLPKPEVTPGADLYLSMAGLQEKANQLDRATEQYEKALKIEPDHLGALLGFARLKDRQGKLEDATKLYERAAEKHPEVAAAQNDLGLCYARRGMLEQSIQSLAKAVKLDPKKALYRNNIATVLVEQKRVDEALEHLRSVHSEAVAYYNVAYLLNQRNDTAGAKAHFHMALEKDPNLAPAREWLAKLEGQPINTGVATEIPTQQPSMSSMRRPIPTPAANDRAPSGNLKAFPVQYPPRSTSSANMGDAPIAPLPEHRYASPHDGDGPALRLLPAVQ
jgi:tetratricopeptide (TPR) repeat protein